MSDPEETAILRPPQRLCSEIQLFDLCELDSCSFKSGSFCTHSELLNRFERISDEERSVPDSYYSEEDDESEDGEDCFADEEDDDYEYDS